MLTKLLMQDNAVDSSGDEELFGPVTCIIDILDYACMRAFRRYVLYHECGRCYFYVLKLTLRKISCYYLLVL